MLHQKNTVNGVQTVYNCFFDIYSVENVTWGEDYLGKNLLDKLAFDLPNTMALVSAVAGSSQMIACTAGLDAEQKTPSAIMPFVISPNRPMLVSTIGEPDGA